jgi:predicted RNase H-like nuclease
MKFFKSARGRKFSILESPRRFQVKQEKYIEANEVSRIFHGSGVQDPFFKHFDQKHKGTFWIP